MTVAYCAMQRAQCVNLSRGVLHRVRSFRSLTAETTTVPYYIYTHIRDIHKRSNGRLAKDRWIEMLDGGLFTNVLYRSLYTSFIVRMKMLCGLLYLTSSMHYRFACNHCYMFENYSFNIFTISFNVLLYRT